MRNLDRATRLLATLTAILVLTSGMPALSATGGGGRNPGPDVSATGFSTHRDIDDPSGSQLYPPGVATINASVRNAGDAAAAGVGMNLEVGRGTPSTVLYADAEAGGNPLPAGWSATDLTLGRWHQTNKTYSSPARSAWCGPEGDIGLQYGAGWEEVLQTANSLTVPSGSPVLSFNHRFVTLPGQDGGYVEIRNMSVSPETWERSNYWSFSAGTYNSQTANINPISKQVDCFGGDSGGWMNVAIELMNYIGHDIKFRFVFSSSGSIIASGLSGWYLDDVKVDNGVVTPLQDDFEGDLSLWTAYNLRTVNNPSGGWGQGWGIFQPAFHDYNASSTKVFSNRDASNNAYFDGEDSVLTSPAIDLTRHTHARLHFWYAIESETGNDGGFLEVQKNGGEWRYLKPFMKGYPLPLDPNSPYGSDTWCYSNATTPPAWDQETFDLSAFAGATVRIRFHFFANDNGATNRGWYIDEVTVKAWSFTVVSSIPQAAFNLNVGESATKTFSPDLSVESWYSLKVTLSLSGEANTANNVAYIIIRVLKNLAVGLDLNVTSPLQVVHGQRASIGVGVANKGNVPNSVDLLVLNLPPTWSSCVTQPNPILVQPGFKVSVGVNITVPVDQANGDFTVRFNATSRNDSTQHADLPLVITVVNGAPSANAGPPKSAKVYAVVTFDGGASSDPDGDALEYSWDFGDGGTAAGRKVNHTYTSAGKYASVLNVSDGGPGSWSTDEVEVTIGDDLPIPKIIIDTEDNNGTYQRGSPVIFNGSESRDEAWALLAFDWDFGDGSDHVQGAVVEHVYLERGTYQVVLKVTDAAGQEGVSPEFEVVINAPPTANISSPSNNARYLTTDDILFSSTGSSDPDGDRLTFEWTSNLMPGTVLGTSGSFTRSLNITGNHRIQLLVYDGKGMQSYGIAMVTVDIRERTNEPPVLLGGTVTPSDADEGTTFHYSVRYSDANNDVPSYIHVIIDGNRLVPQPMLAQDPMDNNYSDGKDYYFNATGALLKGEVHPHNYTFETADKWGSGRVATEPQNGPVVRWYRSVTSWLPDVVRGKVYQTGNFQTQLNGVSVTPPPVPEKKVSLGLAFYLNSTADQDKWYWANITILYSGYNYSKINESTLKVYWSVAEGAWVPVPLAGLDVAGQVLWFNVSSFNAKFAIFGDPVKEEPHPNGDGKKKTEGLPGWLIPLIALVVVAGVGGAAFALLKRKKPAAPPEPSYEEEEPAEPRPPRQAARPAPKPEPPAPVVASTGENVKVFRPGGEEVSIFRPGGGEKEVRVFKPSGAEGEDKVFRPGKEEVVEEEALKPKVVEYEEPPAREAPAEEEEPPEEEGAPEAEEGPGPSKEAPRTDGKKGDDIDELLKEMDGK